MVVATFTTDTLRGLPFAKIAAIYVCICILCAQLAPKFQLESFLNCMHMYANMQQKCRQGKLFFSQ
jgi:hypothetical protein